MDTWISYAPMKNNPEDFAKIPKGNPYHSGTTGEMAIYRAHYKILSKAGVEVEDPEIGVFNGQEFEVLLRIVWSPKWAMTFSELKQKLSSNCQISQNSSFVINGADI